MINSEGKKVRHKKKFDISAESNTVWEMYTPNVKKIQECGYRSIILHASIA